MLNMIRACQTTSNLQPLLVITFKQKLKDKSNYSNNKYEDRLI